MKITKNSNSPRVSLVTFASQSSIRIYCDEYDSSAALHDAIDKLTYKTKDSFTNIKDGLIKGHKALSSRGCGRPKAKRMIVLVTDGKANRGLGGFQAIREKAREIRDTNTTIIAIGIGGNIKYDLLKNLTGGDGNVFTSTTFNDKKLFELASNAMNQQQCQSKFLSLVFFLYKYFFIFKFSIWVYKQGLL